MFSLWPIPTSVVASPRPSIVRRPSSSDSPSSTVVDDHASLDASAAESADEASALSSSDRIVRARTMILRFMVRGTCTPMEWMMDLRSYGLKIVYNTTKPGHIEWNGDLLFDREIQFTMAEFRAWIHGLLADAQSLCSNQVLPHGTTKVPIPSVDLNLLRDNPSNTTFAWSFLHDSRVPWPVDGDEWLHQISHRLDCLRPKFWPNTTTPGPPVPKFVQAYLRQVSTFRAHLLLLIHLTGGQPARMTELLSVRRQNSAKGQPRNLYIDDGLVAFVTRYHKGYSRSGEVKLIYRYLPPPVGQLLVQYLWLVQPFVERLEVWYYRTSQVSAHLWPHEPWGRRWTAEWAREAMEAESLLGLGQRINLQSYRQLAIGISRRHFCTKFHFEDEEESDRRAAASDEVWLENTMALPDAHSLHVAETTYGRSVDQPVHDLASVRQRYRGMSRLWHQFLQLNAPRPARPARPPPAAPPLSGVATAAREKRAGSVGLHNSNPEACKRSRALYDADPMEQLRQLYGMAAAWRPLQEEAVSRVLRGVSPLLVVMPTSAGKSLLFLLPASYQISGVTVVIVPLSSLR